ncbi:MAG: MSHA biogenesis protein MshI [Candidatus Endobugula sp.]|jgi:MSHA biogenesis protein MshI
MFNFFRKNKTPVVVGIQLSRDYISILVLDCQFAETPKIIDYMNYSVGKETSAEKLVFRIKEYLEEHHLSDAKCCLVLDDQDYQLLVVDPPNVPESEMAEAVKWKIKDLIQYPIAEAVVDVFLQSDINSPEKYIANVIVANKEIVDRKAGFIRSVGLCLVAIDIPELCYRNYFERSLYQEKNIALVSIKENYGKIIVIKKSCVYFSRSFSLPYKGGLLDEIPESEVVLELQRSLDYYERQLKQVMPTTAIFFGENVIEDKITEVTRDNLNQEVFVGQVEGFDFTEEDNMASARVMATYGASLRRELFLGVG